MSKTKYSSYKPTNIDWIGKIPVDWEVRKLKYCLNTHFSGIWGNEKQDDNNDIKCIRVADFDYEKLGIVNEIETIRNISTSDKEKKILKKGDLLLEKSGGGEKTPVGRTVLFQEDNQYVCANFIEVLRPKNNYSHKYLNYISNSIYSGKVSTKNIKQNTGIQNLDIYYYLSENIPLPPLSEQQAIANYLDTKTSQIDQIISLKQQQIDLLKERRTALINHVVTKGLDPKVEMVESGIEWIGKIPKGWEVKRLKRIILMINRGMSPDYAEDETNIKIINQSCIYWGSINFEKIKYNIESINMSKRGKIFKGDILMNSTGTGTLGRATVFDINDSNYYADSHVTIIRANKNNNSRYLTYLLSTDMYQNYIYATCVSGSTNQIELSRENMRIVEFISPSLVEQQAIANYLDTKTSQIDQTIIAVEKSIGLLNEYKQSLISRVVTGKVKVF